MYHSLLCKQNNNIMETGKNSKTLDDLKGAILAYISPEYGDDHEDIEKIQAMDSHELADLFNFKIVSHHCKTN